jgi:hypothetical protein
MTFWGAANLVIPARPNRAMICQGALARLTPIRAMPMIAAEAGMSTLGP